MPAAEHVFRRSDSATVWVGYSDTGELVFDGQDGEYSWVPNRVLT